MSPPPLGQADGGRVWRQRPRPGPSGHPRARALAERLAPGHLAAAPPQACVFGVPKRLPAFSRGDAAQREEAAF